MTLLILIGLLALGAYLLRHPFWRRLAGAPDVVGPAQAAARARARAAVLTAAGKENEAVLINLGGVPVPVETLNQPVVEIGVPKTGKSATLAMCYWDLVRLMEQFPGKTRIVWLDVKGERPSFFHASLPEGVPLHILNPLDDRSRQIDWTGLNRAETLQLVHALIPQLENDNAPFFRNWARLLLWSAIRVFQRFAPKARRGWLLSDALLVCADERCLKAVLSLTRETRSLYRAAMRKSAKSSGDVFSTLRSIVQEYSDVVIAERMSVGPKFDIRKFLREDGLAVLGLPPTGSQAVLPLYAVLLQRLIEEARQNADPTDRLFLVLDEIALLGPRFMDTLLAAACVGRSAGIHVLATAQSVEFLRSALGTDKADAFLASCETLIAFRAASRPTAEYVAGRFGQQEGIATLVSRTYAQQGSTSYVQSLTMRPTVMAEAILHLPLADPEADRLEYYAVSPAYGPIHVRTQFTAAAATPKSAEFADFVPRPLDNRGLPSFSAGDAAALGLPMTARLAAYFSTPAQRK